MVAIVGLEKAKRIQTRSNMNESKISPLKDPLFLSFVGRAECTVKEKATSLLPCGARICDH